MNFMTAMFGRVKIAAIGQTGRAGIANVGRAGVAVVGRADVADVGRAGVTGRAGIVGHFHPESTLFSIKSMFDKNLKI